jgi:hypothetical protein
MSFLISVGRRSQRLLVTGFDDGNDDGEEGEDLGTAFEIVLRGLVTGVE